MKGPNRRRDEVYNTKRPAKKFKPTAGSTVAGLRDFSGLPSRKIEVKLWSRCFFQSNRYWQLIIVD